MLIHDFDWMRKDVRSFYRLGCQRGDPVLKSLCSISADAIGGWWNLNWGEQARGSDWSGINGTAVLPSAASCDGRDPVIRCKMFPCHADWQHSYPLLGS
jgi:hypothetical protein